MNQSIIDLKNALDAALAHEAETGGPAAAMELEDGQIILGKTSDLLGALSALLLCSCTASKEWSKSGWDASSWNDRQDMLDSLLDTADFIFDHSVNRHIVDTFEKIVFHIRIYFFQLFYEQFYFLPFRFAYAVTAFIDVFGKTVVGDIHLGKTC